MKSIRLNIRALAFDGKTPIPAGARIIYNSSAGSHDLVGSSSGLIGKFGVLRMKDLVAHGLIAAAESAYVSWAGHSGQAGVTSFEVRSCHLAFGRQIDTSPTRRTNPGAATGQVGPFVLGPTDELLLVSNAGGEQLVTIELLTGAVVEVERMLNRYQGAELGSPVAPHAGTHRSGGGDPLDVAGLSGLLADAQNPLPHAASHVSGGDDPLKLDELAAPGDNTNLDATASAHGLLPKLSGNASEFLSGTGSWSSPSYGPAESLAATLLIGNTTGGTSIEVGNGDAIVGEDGGSIGFAASSGLVQITDASVEVLYVAGAEAGDGPSDADELVIGDGSGSRGATIFSGTTSSGALKFTNTAGTAQGSLSYSHSGDFFAFAVGGASTASLGAATFRPTITDTLDLGISSVRWRNIHASRAAHLAGGVTGHASEADDLSIGDGTSTARGATFYSTSSSAIYFADTLAGSQGGLVYAHSGDILTLRAAAADRLRIAATAVYPASDDSFDLGIREVLRWRDAYFSSSVHVAGGEPTHADANADDLVVGDGTATARGATFYSTLASAIYFADTAGGRQGGIFYVHASDTLAFRAADGDRLALSSTALAPGSDDSLDLGIAGSNRWRTGYFATSVITPLVSGKDFGAGTGAGESTVARGGDGGTTGGVGGAMTVRGGNAQSGNTAGGAVSITGGGSKGTAVGGAVAITGGTGGTSSGAGAGVSITGGLGGGGNANGGEVAIVGGQSTGTGSPGDIRIFGVAPVSGNIEGSDILIVAGDSSGSSGGGDVEINGGRGGGSSGQGGGVDIIAGVGGSSHGRGGRAQIIGGTGGSTNGAGGDVWVTSGEPSGTGSPGMVKISAAAPLSGNVGGGHVNISASDSTGTATGGNVSILSGGASDGGNGGNILLTAGSVSAAGASRGVVKVTNTSLEIAESSSATGPSITAGNGRYWVRNTSPCVPAFTDDTGASYDIVFRPSYSRVTGASSCGSTNTNIYVWGSEVESAGSDINFIDSTISGGYWTIGATGIYAVSVSIRTTAITWQAINVGSLSNTFWDAHVRTLAEIGDLDNNPVPMSWTGPITAGQRVWVSTSTGTDPLSSSYNMITVVRIR